MLRRVARPHRAMAETGVARLVAVRLGRRSGRALVNGANGPGAAIREIARDQQAHERQGVSRSQRQQANSTDEPSRHTQG